MSFPPKSGNDARGSVSNIGLARWIQRLGPSALQRMLQSAGPDLLSLALGLPAPELFPHQACARAVERVLSAGSSVFQYAPPLPRLKSHVVELMRARGVQCSEDQIFLTAGAQQGMSLLTRLLLPQNGKVIVEEFTYPGFLQAVAPFEPQILTIAVDPSAGMNVDTLERILKMSSMPSLIYVMPEGHNPLGTRLSHDSRLRLIELAKWYKVPVIEDDAYGFLSYDDNTVPPLRAFDDKWVLYIGSFSKILAPSFRVGWLVVPPELIPKLSIIKEATDINACPFSQRIVAAYLDEGGLEAHISGLRAHYRQRRDAMVSSLSELLREDASFAIPLSGFFLWVNLHNVNNTSKLLEAALKQENIAFVPGSTFSTNSKASGAVRLNFSHPDIPQIKEGITRLARAVRRFADD